MPVHTILVVAVAARRRRIVRKFEEAGADRPERARRLAELGVHETHLASRLARAGVLATSDGERYFLSADGLVRWKRRRNIYVLTALAFLATLAVVVLFVQLAATAQIQQRASDSGLPTADAQEQFLIRAKIVSERQTPDRQYAWRVTLDDGKRRHDAAVETEDGTTPGRRNYRFNIAAYELDKLLDLRMVAPSVARTIDGRPAALTWWVDDVAMMERDRRAKNIEPPDAVAWRNQIDAVRLFDELTSNPYRNIKSTRESSPTVDDGPPLDYLWMELLITRDWRVWLIDHTGMFRLHKQLQHPETLERCSRALLGNLRSLNRKVFEQKLGRYLSAERLDALEERRVLIVKHFQELIARRGEDNVLYDLVSRW